jgi:hypothetical protein
MDQNKVGLRQLLMILVVLGLSFSAGAAQTTASASDNAGTGDGRKALERLKGLSGEWKALEGKDVMIDRFRPIAGGDAFVYEEWKAGAQLTSTVFYMVGSELRADHFCDFGNQLHYVVKPSADGNSLQFELRDATNLDVHPRHFHSSTWRFVDADHLTQDWQITGGGKEPKTVRLDFTRQK